MKTISLFIWAGWLTYSFCFTIKGMSRINQIALQTDEVFEERIQEDYDKIRHAIAVLGLETLQIMYGVLYFLSFPFGLLLHPYCRYKLSKERYEKARSNRFVKNELGLDLPNW